MSTAHFSSTDLAANTIVSLRLTYGETVTGEVAKLNSNYLELITSTPEAARKLQIAYGHIVYIEQVKVTTAAPSV
jgi:hypothetical protein